MANSNHSGAGLFFFSLRSIPFLLARPRLLGLAAIPLVINFFVFSAIVVGLNYWLTVPILGANQPMGSQLEALADRIAQVLEGSIVIMLTVVLGAFVSFILIIPIGAPFCEMIAKRIEKEMLGPQSSQIPDAPFWPSIRHSLVEAFRRLLFFLPLFVLLFVVAWVPVLGTLTAAVLGFFANAIFLALDGFSYSMDRRFMTFRQKWDFFRANRGTWLPFGIGLSTLALIPCNAFWLPILSCVAASRLYCEKLRESAAPILQASKQ